MKWFWLSLRWLSRAAFIFLLAFSITMWVRSQSTQEMLRKGFCKPGTPTTYTEYWFSSWQKGLAIERVHLELMGETKGFAASVAIELQWNYDLVKPGILVQQMGGWSSTQQRSMKNRLLGAIEYEHDLNEKPAGKWGFPFTVKGKSFMAAREDYHLVLIHWWALVLFSALPLVWWGLRFWLGRKGYGPGKCKNCGYDLRATPGRCPECGSGSVGA